MNQIARPRTVDWIAAIGSIAAFASAVVAVLAILAARRAQVLPLISDQASGALHTLLRLETALKELSELARPGGNEARQHWASVVAGSAAVQHAVVRLGLLIRDDRLAEDVAAMESRYRRLELYARWYAEGWHDIRDQNGHVAVSHREAEGGVTEPSEPPSVGWCEAVAQMAADDQSSLRRIARQIMHAATPRRIEGPGSPELPEDLLASESAAVTKP